MDKKLAPPPHRDLRDKTDQDLKERVEAQRTAARLKAEKRRAGRLTEKKQEFLDTLSQATSEMASMTQELSSSLIELETAMNEIAASSLQASSSADENNTAIAETNSAVGNISENTRGTLEKVGFLLNLLNATSTGITSLINGVNTTTGNTREIVKLVGSLDQQAADIENSVSGVVSVSKKVNLHALNAAIEASRAEEHGAGFSIVADEIRKLAEETSQVASQIIPAIGEVRKNVNMVGKALEELAGKAEADNVKAGEITGNLEKSARDIQSIQQNSEKINSYSQVHSSEVTRLLDNSDLITSGATQAANAVQSALSAIQQQVKAIESIDKNSNDIESQIETMRVEGFSEAMAEEVATSAEELSAIIEECSAAVSQIVAAVAEIAQSAQQQSSSAQANADQVEVVEKAARDMAELAQFNQQILVSQQELVRTIDTEARTMITNTLKMSESYNISSVKISELQDSMDGLEMISQQLASLNVVTNLLAVNGRIESAKAGDLGAGFAKVSEDIRVLVVQADEQTRKIYRGIRMIQKTIGKVAAGVEAAGIQVAREAERGRDSAAGLVQVEKDMVEVVGRVESILQSTSESLSAVEIIKQGIDSISRGADQAAAACQQASAAADQQGKGFRQLAATAEEIASKADAI